MRAVKHFIAYVWQSLVYRGREGQWSHLVHRAAGIGVLLFLGLHIFDIFLLAFGPKVFEDLLFLYKGPLARVLEVLLVFGLVFHGCNGVRIIYLDWKPEKMKYQARYFWYAAAAFSVLFVPAAFFMLRPMFGDVIALLVTLFFWALVPLSAVGSQYLPSALTMDVVEAN